MSVLRCNHAGCKNIMCHNLLAGNYICTDCLTEFNRKRLNWPICLSISEIKQLVADFMSSEPEGEIVDTDDYINKELLK